jgi:hypothetical protein
MTEQNKHLYYIDDLSDYKISDGYPDIRGWDVKDIDNRVIGKVDNLLVNKEAERVVYLDVEVDESIIDAKYDPYGRPAQTDIREFVNKEGQNHIIIPIGLVDLNQDSNYVYTDTINHRTFAETKRYRKGDTIDRSYEDQVLGSYGRRQTSDEEQKKSSASEHELRLREIIREEIRTYHHDSNKNTTYSNSEAYHQSEGVSEDVEDSEIMTDQEMELRRRRDNEASSNDADFYERREFDDKHFKKRTPGL